MATNAATPGLPPIPERLTGLVPLSMMLNASAHDVAERLKEAVQLAAPVEPDAPSDRRLRGAISDKSLRLWLEDSQWQRRRVGWRVELVGQLEANNGSTFLRGTVDIADHGAFRAYVWLFRSAALLPLVFGIATFFGPPHRGGIEGLLFGVAVSAAASIGTFILSWSVEDLAADDARALVTFIGSEFAPSS